MRQQGVRGTYIVYNIFLLNYSLCNVAPSSQLYHIKECNSGAGRVHSTCALPSKLHHCLLQRLHPELLVGEEALKGRQKPEARRRCRQHRFSRRLFMLLSEPKVSLPL